MEAGLEGSPVLIHLTEQQLLDPAMLEDVCLLLRHCEIPGLLDAADSTRIMTALQETMTAPGGFVTKVCCPDSVCDQLR